MFSDIAAKNIDWPEAVWEAWSLFEHFHGSVEQIDTCLDKTEKARYQVNVRRAKVNSLVPRWSPLQIVSFAGA